MNSRYPALELQRPRNRRVAQSLLALKSAKRDLLWLLVVAAMAFSWCVDRSGLRKAADIVPPALAKAQAAAEDARRQQMRLRSELCQVQELTAARQQSDAATIARLQNELRALQAQLSGTPGPRIAIGHER